MPGSYDNTLMPDNSQPIKPDEIPVDDKGRPLPDPTESLSGYIIPSSVDMLKKAYSEVEEDEEVRKTMEPPQRTGFFKKHRPGKRGYDYYGIQSENIPDDGNGLNPSPLSQLFSEAEALEVDFDADEVKNKIIAPPQQMREKVETPKQVYVATDDKDDEDDILKKSEVIKDPNAPSFLDMYKESTNTKVIFQSDLLNDTSSNESKVKSFETEKIFAEHSKLSNAKNKIKKKEEKRALKAALKLEKKKAKERKKAEKAARKAAKGKKGKNIPNNTDNTFDSDIILTAPKEEPSNNQKKAEKAAAEAEKRFEQERIAAQKEKEQAAINLEKEKEAARIAREEAEKLKAELEKMKQEAAQAIAQKEKAEEAVRLAQAEKEKTEEEIRSRIESEKKLRKESEEAKAAAEQTIVQKEEAEDAVITAVSEKVKENISANIPKKNQIQQAEPEKDNNSQNNEDNNNVYSFGDIPVSKKSGFYKSHIVNADDEKNTAANGTEKESLKINKDSIMSRKNKDDQ